MLDLRTQTQLADTAAAMLRSAATASVTAWAASASRGAALWAELLASGLPRPGPQALAWPWLAGGVAAGGAAWAPWACAWPAAGFNPWSPLGDGMAWGAAASAPGQAQAVPPAPPLSPADFAASYRSAGGHAVAQIATLPAAELAGLGANAMLSPMAVLLGAWRAALRA